MSDVNDLSLNIFYSAKPTVTASSPSTGHGNRTPSGPSPRLKKRPRSYPTPVPRLPSFDEKHGTTLIQDEAAEDDSAAPPSKKYVKPAPLYELPKLKARQHSTLSTDALLPSPSALSDPALFSPSSTFASLSISPRLLSALAKLSPPVSHPTRIQFLAIPQLLSHRDAFVRSQTGSGKTLAYLLPLLQSLADLSRASPITRQTGPLALILSPTRELTLQIFSTLSLLLSAYHWIVASTLMGGESKQREKSRLRRGVNILVATPGRLLDHLESTERLDVSGVEWLVMDEADRLLDLGFEREVGQVIKRIEQTKKPGTRRRQNLLVSATIDKGVKRLADLALHDPVYIGFEEKAETEQVDDSTPFSSAPSALPDSITHHVLQVESRHRLVALAAFLRRETMQAEKRGDKCKVIVFLSTCSSVEFHHSLFSQLFWPPPSTSAPSSSEATPLLTSPLYQLHGQMSQKERTAVYHTFSSSSSSILVCTDVAARGLDLPAVDWIVQYDVADEVDDYVHRVGRSGRIGREGKAVIFLTEKELPYLTLLPPAITFHPLALPPILSSLRAGTSSIGLSPSSPPAGALLQRLIESIITGHRALYSLAVSSYQSWVRAYAGYPKRIKAVMGGVAGLHLGHVCRSFGLGDEPTKVGRMREGNGKTGAAADDERRQLRGRKAEAKQERQDKKADGILDTVALFKKRKVDSMAEFAA